MQTIIHGDCLDEMMEIQEKSIDMILCDLPYGTTQNKWDCIIPLKEMWEDYERIIKDNGAIVLTAQQPFTSTLVVSNYKLFKYSWVWVKEAGTGFLNAKKYPLKNNEDILVFCKKPHIYNPQMRIGKPYKCKKGGTTSNYNKDSKDKIITINNGERYPITTLEFSRDKEKLHPTQKPVALFEYLIKTYTNEGDLVLDNCAGSFTTAIASENLKRNWICIEKEEEYCDIGRKRITENRERLRILDNKINK